jgi:isopentenyl-diphosphate delta-isomerase type 1
MAGPAEYFELVDVQGAPIGCATRAACHHNPALLHRVVHVLVWDAAGRLYLQKRAQHKDMQPGKWDTSVGGHVQPGETAEQAARREMREELGLREQLPLVCVHEYLWRSPAESEYVTTYACVFAGVPQPAPDEIDEGRWWTAAELAARADELTPNCREELRRWRPLWPLPYLVRCRW